jgi:hypothetical protein
MSLSSGNFLVVGNTFFLSSFLLLFFWKLLFWKLVSPEPASLTLSEFLLEYCDILSYKLDDIDLVKPEGPAVT